jgi:hypothetical protein
MFKVGAPILRPDGLKVVIDVGGVLSSCTRVDGLEKGSATLSVY